MLKKKCLSFEQLETRETPAVTASFSAGVLTVVGDNLSNNIAVSADVSGNVLVNGSPVSGATRASVSQITVDAGRGNDVITLDKSLNTLDANGSLSRSPNSLIFGGKGNDTVILNNGGIVGGLAGVVNGVVVGPVVGNSIAFGDDGDDTFISGPGNDSFFGGNGDDQYFWPPGTLTDFFDGGKGRDTATIIGNDNASDNFVLGAGPNGLAVFQRTNLVNFTVTMDSVEDIELDPGTGADKVTVNSLAGTDVRSVSVSVDNPGDVVSWVPNKKIKFYS